MFTIYKYSHNSISFVTMAYLVATRQPQAVLCIEAKTDGYWEE